MDFHGMKRKDLQALCKKHGIPANLKNIDMASRLTSVFEKETEETFTDSLSLSEDSVLKDDLVVKKVRFSPENEVFEFTRSVKRCQRKNVRTRSKGINVRDLQGSRIELRRSKRIVSSGSFQENCKVTGLMALEKLEFEDLSEGLSRNDQDGFKLEKIGRRSTRLTSKAGTLLPSKRSKLLVDTEDKEDESVKNNVKEVVSMDFVVQETGKCHRKDVQDDPKVEKVHRRSRRLVNEIDVQTNTQDQRRSIRLKARAVNKSMGGKESKEERKTTKQSKRSMVVNTQEGQLVKNEPKESLIDCEVQTTEDYRRMNVQDVSIVEKVFRRSKRHCNDINVLMDLGVKKAPKQSRQHEKSRTELLVDGQAQKGDKQPKRTFGNGREDKKLLRISTHTTLDNMEDKSAERLERDTVLIAAVKEKPQGMIENSPFSSDTKAAESVMISENVLDSEPEKAVDSSQRTNTQDLNSELMEDKGEERLERDTVLIAAAKEKQGMIENSPFSSDTKAAESIMITKNVLDSEPEKAVDSSQRTNTQELDSEPEKAVDSSQRTNTRELNSELMEDKSEERLERDTVLIAGVKEKPQGMIENSPFSSDNKAAESVMITENVVDSEPEKAVDSSQRTNTQELNSELMKDKSEEGLERDTVLIDAVKEKPQGMIENSPLSSDTKAAESVMITENVLDSEPEKAVDSSQRTNTQELNYEPMEDKSEERLERDTVLIAAVKEKPQGMIENSPFSSATKAAESVMITENVLDSEPEKAVDISQRTNTQELNSELMEDKSEKRLERDTVLIAAVKENKNEVSSCSILLSERLSPASVQCSVSNSKAELIFVKDSASTVIGENTKTKEEILICTPISELKEHSSVEAMLENSAECWKENHPNKDDEKHSLEKEVQAANLHGNFYESNTENNSAEEEMKTTSETKAAEPVMISEKSSVDISPGGNTQELHSELMEGEREEKHEQDIVLMAAIKEKVDSSSLSLFLIERSEVSNPEVEIFVETTPPPNSVLSAVSDPEAELGDPTPHILVKDIASEVIAKEDIKTKKEILISTPRFEVEEHSFVAKLAEAEAECRDEIQSSKDGETCSLKKTVQSENLHGNFSGYNTENSKVGCISFGDCVNLETLNEVKDESLEKSEQRSSFERGCKLNALELRGCSSTDFTSHSLKENNVSKCFEEDKTKALSLPLPRNNDSSAFDELVIFTTPERKLMLMEQISEKGKTLAADSVTQHNDEAVESHALVFTTPQQVSTLGDAGTCSMVSEEPVPSTDIQNQVHDPLEGLAITTDNNDADELIEAKETKNIQIGFEGNLLLNSSGGYYVSGKTCILAGTEDEDDAVGPVATVFEKAISLTPDEFIVQNNMNEKDKEMFRREATPSPEKTLNASLETRKEYLNIDESGALSERQVRREPILIYRTQVKPQRHDMKENAPNSKIEHNLNVTAPRTSKRQPLQDLKKI